MKIPEFITNRSILLVRLKRPFIEWINKCDPDSPLPDEFIEKSTVYLVEDIPFPEPDRIKKIIKKHYKDIFIDQLNSWYTDKNLGEKWKVVENGDGAQLC